MLSKYQDFSHENLDPRNACLTAFFESEAACEITNLKFRNLDLDPSQWDPLMLSIFANARRKISRVLGKLDMSKIARGFGWGPGSTTSVSGNRTSAYNKFKARLDVTSNSLIMGHCCVNSTPSWANCQSMTDDFPSVPVSILRETFNIVRGNEIILVPKNAKTHRMIAKEPTVNAYLQKGFGAYIRKSLLYAGIDLSDQTVNQRYAREGSITNLLATIDLKMASNTISTELVRYLLPHEWFVALDLVRSKQGLLKETGIWYHYQMFCSAGNSYNFELETLIFWALASATTENETNFQPVVYGDDIIVESEYYGRVSEVLSFAGFSINKSKSYDNGPFRESCGKDYFLGNNVRPIFLKKELSNAIELFKLANNLRRYCHSRNFNYGCDSRFRGCWLRLRHGVDRTLWSFTVPEGFGDSGFLTNLDEALPALLRSKRMWEGWICKVVQAVPVKALMKDRHATYVASLYESGSEQPSLNQYSLRKMTRLKISKLHVHEWYDLGPWC